VVAGAQVVSQVERVQVSALARMAGNTVVVAVEVGRAGAARTVG